MENDIDAKKAAIRAAIIRIPTAKLPSIKQVKACEAVGPLSNESILVIYPDINQEDKLLEYVFQVLLAKETKDEEYDAEEIESYGPGRVCYDSLAEYLRTCPTQGGGYY